MNIKEKVKNLPSCPGVYLMKDSLDNIIYVGKSKNLKNRIRSYFQNSRSHSPKVIKLVKHLKNFDYIITDTEFEAFMLECKLIKEIKPLYNSQMKSPESYSYIKITINEDYPDMKICDDYNENDGNIYFGPYTSKSTVERAIQGIKECCKILCNNNSRKSSSCLNYSLNLCIGICLDDTGKKQYLDIIHKIIKLLRGTDKSIIKSIEYKMNMASEEFNFEDAAKYRDYLSAIKYLIDKAKVVKYAKNNKNIALIEYLNENTIKFFLIKGNEVLFNQKYVLTDFEYLKSDIKNNILSYFNNSNTNNSIKIGKEEIDEAQIIYSYLKNDSSICEHIVIQKKWLNELNHVSIDNAINQLLSK